MKQSWIVGSWFDVSCIGTNLELLQGKPTEVVQTYTGKTESEYDPKLLGIMPKMIYKPFLPVPGNKDTDYLHYISLL